MSRASEYDTAMRRIGRSTFNVEVEVDVEIVSNASSTATQPYSVLTHPGSPSSSPDMALIEALEADLVVSWRWLHFRPLRNLFLRRLCGHRLLRPTRPLWRVTV